MTEPSATLYCDGDLYGGYHDDDITITPKEMINMVKMSGFDTLVLWTLHVNKNTADLNFNDTSIIEGGAYCGDNSWLSEMNSIIGGSSGVTRVLFCVGSAGPNDFESIQTLMNSKGPGGGTGPDSYLYKNFQALKKALPVVSGIDFDDEQLYDFATTTGFAKMLVTLGYDVTFCPYQSESFWNGCLKSLDSSGTDSPVTNYNLQCYSGGAGNDPNYWASLVQAEMGSGFPLDGFVVPGLACTRPNGTGMSPSAIKATLTGWAQQTGSQISSGFVWRLGNLVATDPAKAQENLTAYASAVKGAF